MVYGSGFKVSVQGLGFIRVADMKPYTSLMTTNFQFKTETGWNAGYDYFLPVYQARFFYPIKVQGYLARKKQPPPLRTAIGL